MYGKRLYIIAQTTLALISAAGILFAQSDDGYEYNDDDYYTPEQYDTEKNTQPKQSEPERYEYDTDENIPAARSAAPPVNKPKSRSELGKMSREELFRLAFNKSAPDRPRVMMMRLFAEGRAFGNTEIVYDGNFSSFDFKSPPLSRFLDALLLPEERGAAGDSSGGFNSAALRAAGYEVSVNELTYDMYITIPPNSKVLRKTDLRGGSRREPSGEEIMPAAAAFHANYYLEDYLRYDYGTGGGGGVGGVDTLWREAAALNFDGALNVSGWVLEASSSRFEEPRGGDSLTWANFQRGDVRLVRDFVGLRSRLTAGEVNMSSEMLGGEVIGGARWEYNGWLFGNDPRADRNSVEFFLPQNGYVEVHINGLFRQSVYLPAGHHQLSGFGGNVGRNSVRLVLRMADGGIEEIPFEFTLGDSRNVPKGDVRWSAAAGLRRGGAPSPAAYRYYAEEPLAGTDAVYGLLHTLSAGLAAQASRESGLAGAQLIWTPGAAGLVNLRGCMSYAENGRVGERAELYYSADFRRAIKHLNLWLTGDVNREPVPNVSFSARGYYQSILYSNAMNGAPRENAVIGGVSGNVGFGFLNGSFSATGGASFNRETAGGAGYPPVDYNYGARISQSLHRVSAHASGGVNVSGGVGRPYFSAGTNCVLGARARVKNHQFTASGGAGLNTSYTAPAVRRVDSTPDGYDTVWTPERYDYDWFGSANAGWRWSNSGNGTGAQAYSANASLLNNFTTPVGRASARQSHNRAEVLADYNVTGYGYERYNNMARAQLNGSFMFADGLWAFGRPTGGNFVLVDTRYDLRGARVHVDRSHSNMRDFSHNGWFGAAYQNHAMEYQPTELTLTLTEVPPGVVMERNKYHVNGTYKRGHALRIGSKEQVIVQCRLTENGKPLSYVYVTVEPNRDWPSGESKEKRATFTGGDGVVQIGGLTAGVSYRLKFGSSTYIKDVIIEVPEDAGAIIELPDIAVERE